LTKLIHKDTTRLTAVKIAAEIEQSIRAGRSKPGEQLPTVRNLAGELGVSPATVASAYRMLQSRALLISQGKRGTRISHRPLAAAARRPAFVPKNAINLSDGNPDPALLPSFARALKQLDGKPRLYGEEPLHRGLVNLMRREMKTDGLAANHIAIINGTMDGLDRLFSEWLRPGDRVAVEDPGFTGHHDLVASRGLALAPIAMDDQGMLPDSLARACATGGMHAVLITPRAQSPTGAALSKSRANQLKAILRKHPDVLIIEDDHMSFLHQGEYHAVHDSTSRWVHLRSFSKSFNPDLRLSVMTGDDQTMTRILDRLIVVERWVSSILQSIAFALASDAQVRAQITKTGTTYDQRREALMRALRSHHLQPMGASGFNIWLPVSEETTTVQALGDKGWAVAAGERFRLASPPGVRITVSRLEARDATRLADDMASILRRRDGYSA
jgi:DNA-binding transcriptional MocR family regulator